MTSRARWLILGFALAGLAFATASAYVHYRLLTDPTFTSPCDVNSTFNCTQAYLSQYGSVGGVPVALFGVSWFALVALIALMSAPSQAGGPNPAVGYVFALATVGLAAVLYLGYVSYALLKTVCLLCTGTYISVIGIFIVSGLTASEGLIRLPARLFSDLRALASKPVMLVVAILYVGGTGSAVALFPREAAPQTPPPPPSQSAAQNFASAWAAQPRVDLGIPAGSAKVVVVKFNDWLCPGCKAMHMAYEPILQKYAKSNPGAVKYVVKDWPWSATCNFNIASTIHGHEASCQAAASVRMARDRGQGDAMVDWLFANQEQLVGYDLAGNTDAAVAAIKNEAAKLGVKDFDLQYPSKLADIRRDVADGGVLEVHVTPTFFVNGVRTTDANGNNLPAEYFDLAIKLELEKHAGQ
jgi:uncharacterized membrane protein/protein-disulfide isomerase